MLARLRVGYPKGVASTTAGMPGASASTSRPNACCDSAKSSRIWKRGSSLLLVEIRRRTWPSSGVAPASLGKEISKRSADDCARSGEREMAKRRVAIVHQRSDLADKLGPPEDGR